MAVVEVRYRFDTGTDDGDPGGIVPVDPATEPDITVTSVRSAPGMIQWSATDKAGNTVKLKMPIIDIDGITADLSVPALLAADGIEGA